MRPDIDVRRADARFLLNADSSRIAVLPSLAAAWGEALGRAGGEITASPPADVAVGTTAEAEAAVATGASSVILEGKPARLPAGLVARHFYAVPSPSAPQLIVPADRPRVARYVLENWIVPQSRLKLARARVANAAPLAALDRAFGRRLTIASRSAAPPLLVAGAGPFGVPADADWFAVCGNGDALARGVVMLFERDGAVPRWAVKFSRVPGHVVPFELDEAGLHVAQVAGPVVSSHAPRLLGRFAVEGREASVETAAVGARLNLLLRSPMPVRAKHAIVEGIVEWILEVGRRTAGSAGGRWPLLDPLRREWGTAGEALLDEIADVPTVVLHDDLGAWNIVADRRGSFVAVDWEDARLEGPPLWDLWYFLAGALPLVDGTHRDKEAAFVRLFRGDAPSSARLFAWTRRAVAELDIDEASVGPLATLCWMHHTVSRTTRQEWLDRHAGEEAPIWDADRYAAQWLADPALGTGWARWR